MNHLANIGSAKKRINTTAKKTLRNKMIKSRTKTAIKKVYTASASGGDATAALSQATASIDKAASKGVLHKNTAARKKSRLQRMINKLN